MELLIFIGVIVIVVVLIKAVLSSSSNVLPEDTLFNKGNSYAERGEYDQAIFNYTATLEVNPNHIKALTNRGNSYAEKGEYDKAIADYTAILKINPNDVVALTCRGLGLYPIRYTQLSNFP